MPLRERGTNTIQAVADAFLSSPRYANWNTRRGYTGNFERWQLATDSDGSAGRAPCDIRLIMVGNLVTVMASGAAPEGSLCAL